MNKPSQFDAYNLKKGQIRGAGGNALTNLFSKIKKQDMTGKVDSEQVVGKFKGLIEVSNEKENKSYLHRR